MQRKRMEKKEEADRMRMKDKDGWEIKKIYKKRKVLKNNKQKD